MPKLKDSTYEKVAQGYAADKLGTVIARELDITARRVYRIRETKQVQKRISELTGIAIANLGLSPELVIMGIMDIAYSEVETTTNKLKAYELLGKHLGMFVTQVEDVTDRGHDEWVKMVVVQAKGEDVGDLSFLS